MSSKKEYINIKVTAESIRDSLVKKIVSEHSMLIANVIIANLSTTEVGLEQLFKALSGTVEVPKYKVGDRIMVEFSRTYGWQFNKAHTKDAGLVIRDRIAGQIVNIDPCKVANYEIALVGLDDNKQPKKLTMNTDETGICLEDEWPLDDPDVPF